MRPIIGVTPDEGLTNARPGRPPAARFELKKSYTDAITKAGGLPIALPYVDDEAAIAQLASMLQGLVVTGGAFDIAPEEYGEAARPELGVVKPARTRFERRILEIALERGIPVLGVCGGMQLLNVVRGGTLLQDIRTHDPRAMDHEQPHDPREPAHAVAVSDGSLLHRLCGMSSLQVNTTHHQAAARIGRDLRASGVAPDGVVEAIEGTGTAFVLGVQWHPEMLSDDANQAIYRGFVEATRG